jgi:hypothetical protein
MHCGYGPLRNRTRSWRGRKMVRGKAVDGGDLRRFRIWHREETEGMDYE